MPGQPADLARRAPRPDTYERSTTPPVQWSDAAYATSLRTRAATGTLTTAQAFPAVRNAQPGDPRTRYPDTTWYERNHFLVVLTNAHDPEPAMNRTHPKAAAAAARVARLAAAGASFVSTDWSTTHPVLSDLLPAAEAGLCPWSSRRRGAGRRLSPGAAGVRGDAAQRSPCDGYFGPSAAAGDERR
ncbi:hypothetical protein ACU686_13760 [Yinghuangia aomiensis]